METEQSRQSAVGLSVGLFASMVSLMIMWTITGVLWLPVAHFLGILGSWILAWRVCARAGERVIARAVMIVGLLVVIGGIFGLLGVFVRVYN